MKGPIGFYYTVFHDRCDWDDSPQCRPLRNDPFAVIVIFVYRPFYELSLHLNFTDTLFKFYLMFFSSFFFFNDFFVVPTSIIGSTEALPILCVSDFCERRERERERERDACDVNRYHAEIASDHAYDYLDGAQTQRVDAFWACRVRVFMYMY